MMRNKPAPVALADAEDPHQLYELAVQCAEAEVDFIDKNFRLLRGRTALVLREDFCGTAAVCCEWVRRRKRNRGFGVDIDGDILSWGRRNNVSRLPPEAARRLSLIEGDVLSVEAPPPDAVAALNFSYWLIKDRPTLKRYFRRVRESLKDDGVFFLDAYGGYDSHRVISEERSVWHNGQAFTYVWEQEQFDPISHRMVCHIHFRFPDGSSLERAFSYDWRLWTLPEIRELLLEAGFRRVISYWQGWTAEGTPDGHFRPAERGQPDAGWICYLTAEK
jgi:SAM-dependent methyltransferase